MSQDHPPLASRERRIATLLALPAIVIALVLCGVEGWRVVRPQSSLFMPPTATSLGDAIAQRDLVQAYQFIRHGTDPNELIAVHDPALTGGRTVGVSPLLWATAARNVEAVRMLLNFGVRMDREANWKAVCFAETLRIDEIVRVLRASEGGAAAPCDEVAAGEAPLLRFAN